MMKNTLLLLLWLVAFGAQAQPLFTACDSIDANRISAVASVHGDLWDNPGTADTHCRFPIGSKKNINRLGGVWVSGYDDAGLLHISAQTSRFNGNDYWPGPLNIVGETSYEQSESWAKVWKVRRSEINAFLAESVHTMANTPISILTWPAKGSVYAQGKDGAPLGILRDMAPFVDINGDGFYQPLMGEYPDVPGEQAMWWVYSDNGPAHTQTNGRPLKVEIHAMAYAYKRNTLIDYVVYYDFTIVNRSGQNYRDMRLSLWDLGLVGAYGDEYIAFDSSRRMGVIFNGNNSDGAASGAPGWSYGANPPAMGVTIVHMPGDRPGGYVPVGSMMRYLGNLMVHVLPVADTTYNNYMRGTTWGAGPYATMPAGWNECGTGNTSGDRCMILSTNDFSLPAGGREKVVMAMVVDSAAKGCPVFDITGIQRVADTAWQLYHTQVGVPSVARRFAGLQVYPNPAQGMLHITGMVGGTTHVTVYNVLGQPMGPAVAVRGAEATIAVGHLPAGTYVVTGSSEEGVVRGVFVKK